MTRAFKKIKIIDLLFILLISGTAIYALTLGIFTLINGGGFEHISLR